MLEDNVADQDDSIKFRLRRNPAPPEFYSPSAHVVDLHVPTTYEEAMSSPEKHKWQQAMQEELDSLQSKECYEHVPRPPGKVIPLKWVFVIKTDEKGEPVRYKARLVAKGFMQVEGIDFGEVYAPVCTHPTRRTLFALAARQGLHLHHLGCQNCISEW